MDAVEEVKSRLSIEDVIAEYVQPYKSDPAVLQALSVASVSAFHTGIITIAGGAISLIGIKNPSQKT